MGGVEFEGKFRNLTGFGIPFVSVGKVGKMRMVRDVVRY